MFYNVHAHCHNKNHVPSRFTGAIQPLLNARLTRKPITWIMRNLVFWTPNDSLDRYANLAETYGNKTALQICDEEIQNWGDDWSHVMLSMDMEYMQAGKVKVPYIKQLEEISAVAKLRPQIIPFVHIDTRRPNAYDFFVNAIEKLGFKGLKLYPKLGYYPHESVLYDIYEYCEDHNLPVIAHCTDTNPVNFRGSDEELMKLLNVDKLPYKDRTKNCSLFGHPIEYIHIANRFKGVRFNLAHLGGSASILGQNKEYFNSLIYTMKQCPNIYSDVSFTMFEKDCYDVIINLIDGELGDRILFGTDFPLNMSVGKESEGALDFIEAIGLDRFDKIVRNSEKFINGK